MNKKLITASTVAAMLAAPATMLALFNPGLAPNTVSGISINGFIDILLNLLWPIAVAFFIIMFLLASFQFFTAQGDPDGVKKARDFVIWGIVGVVVALLAFSIPFVVRTTLNQNGVGV